MYKINISYKKSMFNYHNELIRLDIYKNMVKKGLSDCYTVECINDLHRVWFRLGLFNL